VAEGCDHLEGADAISDCGSCARWRAGASCRTNRRKIRMIKNRSKSRKMNLLKFLKSLFLILKA